MRVLDGAVAVFCGVAGVQPQSETVWRQATEFKVPRLIFANKMDKMGANFEYSLKTIKDRLGVNAKPIQWPIGAENEFLGIIDLVSRKAYHYDRKEDENPTDIAIAEDMKDLIAQKRNELIEAVAEFDDELMEKYLADEEISIDLLKRAIRKGTLAVEFFPVLCGTALGNTGVKLLLDAVIDYLPAPTDVESIKGTDHHDKEVLRHPSDSEPFSALALKL
jgi:elongation factor G